MAKTSLSSAVSISPAMSAALIRSQTAFDSQSQIVMAVRRTAEQLVEAEQQLQQSTVDLGELEKQHAIAEAKVAVDPEHKAEVTKLRKEIDKARGAVDAANVEIDRCNRVKPILHEEAHKADEEIAAARAELKQAAACLAKDMEPVFAEQVRSSIAQLAKAVSQARAIGAGLPDGFMPHLLAAMRIVDPASAAVIHTADGPVINGADLLVLPPNDLDVVTITTTLQPIVEMERRFRGHRKFTPPSVAAIDQYKVKGSPVSGRVAVEPTPLPPSTWKGNSWTTGDRFSARDRGLGADMSTGAALAVQADEAERQ